MIPCTEFSIVDLQLILNCGAMCSVAVFFFNHSSAYVPSSAFFFVVLPFLSEQRCFACLFQIHSYLFFVEAKLISLECTGHGNQHKSIRDHVQVPVGGDVFCNCFPSEVAQRSNEICIEF